MELCHILRKSKSLVLLRKRLTAFDLESSSVHIFPSGEYLKQILDRKAKRKVQAGKTCRQVL